MSELFSESVTLLARGPIVGKNSTNDNVYGSPVATVTPGWVEAGFGPEVTDQADMVTKDYTLWLDGRVDLTPYDDVSYNGETFNIAGDVAYQAGGLIVPGWTNARLEKVTG